jgi:hypothetical protein
MSIVSTIQSPPIWSPAYNPIVWMVDSDQTTQFKFRYVFDVYIFESGGFVRFKVPPNPKGKGLIDVSTLVQSYLENPLNLPFLSGTPFYSGEYLATNVYLKVGEEYSLTATGDPILYDGFGNVGNPAYGLYADSNFRPCPNATTPVIAYSAAQSANGYYDYIAVGGESILDFEMALGQVPDTGGRFLTACTDPIQTIRSDEDFTLTWLNRNFEAATGPQTFPYAMKVSLYDNGTYIGNKEYYNTVANGGIWPTCSTAPSPATGASGPENYLYSFKINPADITSYTQDQEALFDGKYGCEFIPISEIFPGYHDSGLSPASNPSIGAFPYDDSYIQPQFNSNCTTGFGIGYTGWSDLVYKDMTVTIGDVISIEIPSQNSFAGSHPSMYLWGATGASSNPAKWEQIAVFTVTNSGGNKLYRVNHTATKAYTSLGLRWFSATSVSCGSFGCFSNYWNITSPITTAGFDKMCLALYPYATYGTCSLGTTPVSEEICLNIDDTNCWGFEPIRFTWLNQLGGRDWYTFIKRNTYTQSAERQTLYRVPGYWSAATYNVQDNSPARYGNTVFKTSLVNNWTASTDWITEEQSNWLRTMFASSSVFAYLPGRSQPCAVILQDAEYSVQTYAREKLFQYFVSFTEAIPDNTQSY